MNRKTLLSVSALALVAMAGAANAADVGPLPRDWSGLYGGLHIGLATEPDSSLKIESSTNELTESVSTLAPVSKIRCYKYTNKGKYIENEFDKCPTGWTEVKTGDDDDDDGGGTIVNPLANLSSGDDLNFLAGINIGYNYQHGRMVFGVEADISGIPDGTERLSGETLDLAGDGSYALTSASGEFGVSNVMTLRARLGYDIDGTWMPFITGGLG